jgi:hypothetical protein
MRIARTSGAALLALLVAWSAVAGPAAGQSTSSAPPPGSGGDGNPPAPGPASKSKLEEMLDQALKGNPDLRVAAAKVQEAEAELNRTRLEVTRRVVTLYTGLEAARKTVEVAEKRRDQLKQLAANKAVSSEDLQVAETAVMQAKADLAKLEADVPYLLGTQQAARIAVPLTFAFTPDGGRLAAEAADGKVRVWDVVSGVELVAPTSRPVQGTAAERIRKALDSTVSVDFQNKPLAEILVYFQKDYDLPLVFRAREPSQSVTLQLGSQPLGAVLQALGDLYGVEFVVRDYGIFVCPPGQAPPAGAVRLHDFWKTRPAATGRVGAGPDENPPPGRIEGNVKALSDTGLLRLTVGSDAGLAKGHTLELFRLNPTRKYLGRLRVEDVSPTESIARPAGAMREKPQVGDVVASPIRWRGLDTPSGDVEARVKKAETNGSSQLDAGKEAGLQLHRIYELFRGPGAAKYVGRVNVQDINPDGAVIGPVGPPGLKEQLREGDRVTLRPYTP